MKRPEFIESLKARASLSNRVSIGGNNALILIRYVEVLERGFDLLGGTDAKPWILDEAERELEAQP